MSYTKAVTLWCDGVRTPAGLELCVEWTSSEGQHSYRPDTVTDVRQYARGFGWTYRGRRDRCADCSARQSVVDAETAKVEAG